MRLLLVLLGLTQSLWTAKIVGLDVTIDGHTSTGPISQYWITWGDGTPDVKSRSPISVHHYAKAGVFTVRQQVFDSATRRWYSAGATKSITVTAATQPPVARVDTVTLTRVDTLLLPSKPDTEYVVRTAWLHDTVAYAIPNAPSSFVDSLAIPNGYTVYRAELAGVILKRDGKFAAQVSSACPASMVPPPPLKMALFCPIYSYSTRDSAVTRILTTP